MSTTYYLIKEIDADNLLADRGYDDQKIVDFVESKGINGVIPSKKNHKI